jgi:hypothetical protein
MARRANHGQDGAPATGAGTRFVSLCVRVPLLGVLSAVNAFSYGTTIISARVKLNFRSAGLNRLT